MGFCPHAPDDAPIGDTEHLRNQVLEVVDGYPWARPRASDLTVTCHFHVGEDALGQGDPRTPSGAISRIREGSHLMLHFSLNELRGISPPALEGWLNLILKESELELNLGVGRFNFKNQILPMFPVSGSAVLVVRELVELIDRTLLRYLAVDELLHLGRGETLAAYCRYDLHAGRVNESHYMEAISRTWIRAFFLCRKAQSYVVAFLLDRNDVISRGGLGADWQRVNGYVMEDRILLDQLAALPSRHAQGPYSRTLVEMFRLVRDHLLRPRQGPGAAAEVH